MATLPIIQSGRMENIGIPGAVTPNVQAPQVDYVGLRQAATSQQQMAQTLDRLSAQLFRVAGEEAQRAGLQYVADNPVTDEQLQVAAQGDPTPLVPTQGGSIFDQAVRKARALELSGRFEAEARQQLTSMLAAIEAGDQKASTENIQTAINTMMNGMGKSLAQVDPEASLKFRASIASSGNTVIQKAAEAQLKREKQARLIRFDANFDNVTRLVEAEISQGFWMDPTTGQKRSIEDRLQMYRTAISTEATLLGDANVARTYSDKFDAAVRQAKVNAVTKHLITDPQAMADPEATMRKLVVGDAGKMSDVLKGMILTDYASVEKVSANFMTAVNNANTLAERRKKAELDAGTKQAINILEQIYVLPETDPKRRTLAAQLTQLPEGSVPIGVLKDVLEPPKPGEGNPAVEFNVLQGIYNGSITEPGQIWSRVGKGLTGKQAVSLLKTLTAEDRRDSRELDTGINRLAGIPTAPGITVALDPKGQEFQRRQQLQAEALQIQAEATRDGKVLTPRQVLTQLETNLEKRRNSEGAKAARKQLEVYEKRDWVGGSITRDTLPALERKAGTNAQRLRELTQIKRLLEQSEGNQ